MLDLIRGSLGLGADRTVAVAGTGVLAERVKALAETRVRYTRSRRRWCLTRSLLGWLLYLEYLLKSVLFDGIRTRSFPWTILEDVLHAGHPVVDP